MLLHRENSCNRDKRAIIDVRVAVRTYGSTKLLKLHTSSEPSSNYKLRGLATLSRADIGDGVVVDMKHVHSSNDVLVVGDRGVIYQWHISNGDKSTSALNVLVLKLRFNTNSTIIERSSIMRESHPQLRTMVVFGDFLLILVLLVISLCQVIA